MQTLVLGATGFIGGQIAKAAIQQGWPVRGLRRNPTSVGDLAKQPIEWVAGDLHDPDSLVQAMQGCQVVFHAAAFYPKSSDPRQLSEQMTAAQAEIEYVIQAAQQAGVERLIYTSTLTTIGHPPQGEDRLADERDHYQPGDLAKSGYYETKKLMENIVLSAAERGFPVVTLNPTAVFGPGDVHITLGSLLIAVAKGWMRGWLPGEINVVDVRDVAQAHIQAALSGQIGERYIIGGYNLTIRDALVQAAEALHVRPPSFEVPMWGVKFLVWLGDIFPFLPLPANHMRALEHWQGYNTSKAEQALNLTARPFAETVRDAIVWFKAHDKY